MKEYMMIVGCEILDNDWMECKLVPLTTVKAKKPSLMDLASGDLGMIQKAISGDKQYKTVLPVKVEAWGAMKLKIGSHVSIEMVSEEK